MPISLDCVGKVHEARFQYTWKDAVLYALSIGARREELDYLYEGRGPKVFPTFAVVAGFEACESLYKNLGGNLTGLVHGSQSVRVHRPLPSGGDLVAHAEVKHVYDLKRMAQVVLATSTRDASGAVYAEAEMNLIFRLDGNFGGEPPPRRPDTKPPQRDADWVWQEAISREQALLYRLNGDLNPLHADPDFAEKAGFSDPILHGLCTYGMVGRAVVLRAAGGDGARLKSLSGQFRNPVFPGDTLRVEGWQEGSQVWLKAFTLENPSHPVFDRATAEIIDA
jgi:acyl dehydratase